MITDLILSALYSVISSLVTFMPSWTLPDVSGLNQNILVDGAQFDAVIPVHQAALAFIAVVGTIVAFQLWGLGVWVWHQIHGAD